MFIHNVDGQWFFLFVELLIIIIIINNKVCVFVLKAITTIKLMTLFRRWCFGSTSVCLKISSLIKIISVDTTSTLTHTQNNKKNQYSLIS